MNSLAATTTMTAPTSLKDRLIKIGLQAIAWMLEDFLARITKGRLSHVQMLEEIVRLEEIDQHRRSLEEPTAAGTHRPLQADGRLRLELAQEDRTRPDRALPHPRLHPRGPQSRDRRLERPGQDHDRQKRRTPGRAPGFSVVCTTAAELIEDLRACSPDTLRRRVARFTRPQLLVIDEVGYLSYDSHAADLPYKVVDRRYERLDDDKDAPSRSILITTNLAFRDWNAHPSRRRHLDRGRELPQAREPKEAAARRKKK